MNKKFMNILIITLLLFGIFGVVSPVYGAPCSSIGTYNYNVLNGLGGNGYVPANDYAIYFDVTQEVKNVYIGITAAQPNNGNPYNYVYMVFSTGDRPYECIGCDMYGTRYDDNRWTLYAYNYDVASISGKTINELLTEFVGVPTASNGNQPCSEVYICTTKFNGNYYLPFNGTWSASTGTDIDALAPYTLNRVELATYDTSGNYIASPTHYAIIEQPCDPPEWYVPPCGDGICNGDENCSTCEVDCGACVIPSTTPETNYFYIFTANGQIDNIPLEQSFPIVLSQSTTNNYNYEESSYGLIEYNINDGTSWQRVVFVHDGSKYIYNPTYYLAGKYTFRGDQLSNELSIYVGLDDTAYGEVDNETLASCGQHYPITIDVIGEKYKILGGNKYTLDVYYQQGGNCPTGTGSWNLQVGPKIPVKFNIDIPAGIVKFVVNETYPKYPSEGHTGIATYNITGPGIYTVTLGDTKPLDNIPTSPTTCGNGQPDPGETFENCPSDVGDPCARCIGLPTGETATGWVCPETLPMFGCIDFAGLDDTYLTAKNKNPATGKMTIPCSCRSSCTQCGGTQTTDGEGEDDNNNGTDDRIEVQNDPYGDADGDGIFNKDDNRPFHADITGHGTLEVYVQDTSTSNYGLTQCAPTNACDNGNKLAVTIYDMPDGENPNKQVNVCSCSNTINVPKITGVPVGTHRIQLTWTHNDNGIVRTKVYDNFISINENSNTLLTWDFSTMPYNDNIINIDVRLKNAPNKLFHTVTAKGEKYLCTAYDINPTDCNLIQTLPLQTFKDIYNVEWKNLTIEEGYWWFTINLDGVEKHFRVYVTETDLERGYIELDWNTCLDGIKIRVFNSAETPEERNLKHQYTFKIWNVEGKETVETIKSTFLTKVTGDYTYSVPKSACVYDFINLRINMTELENPEGNSVIEFPLITTAGSSYQASGIFGDATLVFDLNPSDPRVGCEGPGCLGYDDSEPGDDNPIPPVDVPPEVVDEDIWYETYIRLQTPDNCVQGHYDIHDTSLDISWVIEDGRVIHAPIFENGEWLYYDGEIKGSSQLIGGWVLLGYTSPGLPEGELMYKAKWGDYNKSGILSVTKVTTANTPLSITVPCSATISGEPSILERLAMFFPIILIGLLIGIILILLGMLLGPRFMMMGIVIIIITLLIVIVAPIKILDILLNFVGELL